MKDEEKTREQLLAENESLRAMFSELKKAESECRWVEAALRESEERYKRLLESVTDYIYTVKVENGRPVSTSHGPGCLAVTGYTSEYFQIYPHLWYEMVYEEDREAVLNQVEKILSGEAVQPFEHRIICKDGSIRWVRNTPVPHYDKDGRLLSYDGIIVDISERKKAEEALKESMERYRILFNSGNDAVFVHPMTENGKPGKFIEVNDVACQRLGYTREELLNMSPLDIDAPEEVSDVPRRGKKILADKYVIFERIHVGKDERRIPVEINARLFELKGQQMVLSIARDGTERKKTEEAMRASREYARNIIESSMDMIIAVDNDRRITEFNKAAQETFGYAPEEVLGKHIDILYADPSEGLMVHNVAMENGRYLQVIVNRRKNGELFPSLLSASVLRNCQGDVVGLMGISHDVTRRKQNEEASSEEYRQMWDTIVSGREWRGTFHNKKKSGEYFWESASISAVREREGAITNFIKVAEDITERKRMKERQKILYEFSQRLVSSLDLDVRLRSVCQAVSEMGYRMAWIGTLKADTKDVIPMAQAGFENGYLSSIKVKFDDSPLGQGPTGRAIKGKRPEIQNHIGTDPRYEPWRTAALEMGYGSSSAFPIIDKNNVIAILNVYHTEDEFPQRDVDFLQTFANQTAAYIKNAQLFGEVKETADSLRQEMEVTSHLLMIAEATAHR